MVYNSAGVFKCLACATLAGRRKPGVFKETIMKIYHVHHRYAHTARDYYFPSLEAATAWNEYNFTQRRNTLIARIENKLTLPLELEGFDPGPNYERITRQTLRSLNLFDYTDPELRDFQNEWFLCSHFSDDSFFHPHGDHRNYYHFSSWMSEYQKKESTP